MFKMANRGRYIAVAAPGVEILALAPATPISHHGNVGCRGACQRDCGAVARTQPVAQAKGYSLVIMTTAKPLELTARSGLWCRPGECLSRRDQAGPHPAKDAGPQAKQ